MLTRSSGSRGSHTDKTVDEVLDEFAVDEYARTLYMQLANIPAVGDREYQLDGFEAERRLRIARNAVTIIQEGARRWLTLYRREKARWKVTRRGYLNYSSVRPKDRVAAAARKANVEQRGWHAPLNRRYQALGPPRLDFGRKPDWGEWAVRTSNDGLPRPTALAGERNVFIGHGETVQGAVPKFGFAYYQTFMNDPSADLKVIVEATSGDPDLFMSRNDPRPDAVSSAARAPTPAPAPRPDPHPQPQPQPQPQLQP